MNLKLLFIGAAFFIVGLLMYLNVRSRKHASKDTSWKGQLLPQFIQFWITAILSMIVELVFILKSIINQ